MLGLDGDVLGVYLTVCDILRKLLRNFGRGSDRESRKYVRVDLTHCVGICFVARNTLTNAHHYSSFTKSIAPKGHTFQQMPQPLQYS